ncbi:MAG: CoA transferase [Gammaproteobacteria bacterium]|nr:CoA transferase [Gammaproteobacteria bacterium]NIP88540.1 CoA transferase [Gammaproteobacteria bacterium]NIR23261.1 CoA transferase [Gammaproteobacteria bacterium]NIS04832.1 CoA transferase [Gammaproteobacteria bacterium]NIU40110.1 CoA transferase [Gammaproteobacteria bacterium]
MTLPLENVRVLDLSRALSGPFCTMILGDLGAEVIKVEPLPDGEMMRAWGPFHEGIGVFYLSINRNKRSLAIDFRSEQGVHLLRTLATRVDVLVDNFKPGTMRAMGLDYASLREANPRLVHASITGFGDEGPYGTWPGFDQIAQGMSGLMSISGFADGEPTRVGVPIGDLVAGMWTATGITAAIAQRHVTGEGQKVDTSLLASLVGMLCVQGQRYLSLGEVPGRAGNDHPVIFPYGTFTASDGLLNLAAATEGMWATLCRVLDLEALRDHPDFADNSARSSNRERLREKLNARLRTRPALEWTRELIDAGIPAGPIYTLDQVFNDPHVLHNGFAESIEHPVIGQLRQLSNPLRMGSIGKRTVRSHPPMLGEHSEAVLGDFGLAADEIARLLADGVVAGSARGRS